MSFFDRISEAAAEHLPRAREAFRNQGTEPVETLVIDGDGSLLPAHGILKEMGYRVGKSGLLPNERREILRRTFRVQLASPSGAASDYIAEWGGRCSQARFEKMDRVLGGLAANAARK